MAECRLQRIVASASLHLGSVKIVTPDIINISVNRARGQLVGTASATFHLKEVTSEGLLGGTRVVLKILGQTVFTGVVKRVVVQPSLRCAGEVIVRIQAEDEMFKLQNRLITRRQKLAGLGVIAFISSVVHRTYTGWDDPSQLHDIANSNSPIDIISTTVNIREHKQLLQGGETNLAGNLHPIMKNSDPLVGGPKSGGGGTGGGLILHDHASLDLDGEKPGGGPSFGVFSVK